MIHGIGPSFQARGSSSKTNPADKETLTEKWHAWRRKSKIRSQYGENRVDRVIDRWLPVRNLNRIETETVTRDAFYKLPDSEIEELMRLEAARLKNSRDCFNYREEREMDTYLRDKFGP